MKNKSCGNNFKKKYIWILVLITCLFTSAGISAIPASETGGLGDVNDDGDVNIIDALMVAQSYVGLNPQPFNNSRADVNNDGVINIIDALMLAQYYVGLITIAPPGTPAPVFSPSPGSWTGEYRILFKHSGMALSLENGNTGSGANIIQRTSVGGSEDQIWIPEEVDSGYYRIVNKKSGHVLEVADASPDNGANIQQGSYSGSASQQWAVVEVETGYYQLQNRLSSKPLDVEGRQTTNGANVLLWEDTGNDNQKCRIVQAAGETPGPEPGTNISIYIAGDSTVQNYSAGYAPQAGWGQMLPEYFNSLAAIDNRAIGGRTARRFIDEGRLDEILNIIRPGDYLFVQFGTNDGHRTATYTINGETIPYYLDPQTDFKYYLGQYIDGARSRGAILIFVTPPPRNSAYCTGGNGTGAHAQAIRELGAVENVPVADLNTLSVNYLKAICPAPQPEDFFLLRSDGSVDGTHFQENGARILAGFIAGSIRAQNLPLAGYLVP